MAEKLELSFHKGSKQWCKKVKQPDGRWKAMYFGAGKNKSDRSRYRKALAKYKIWKDEREIAEQFEKYLARYEKSLAHALRTYADARDKEPPATAEPAVNGVERLSNAILGQSHDQIEKPPGLLEMTDDQLAAIAQQPDIAADMLAKRLLYSRSSAERKANPKKGDTVADHIQTWLTAEGLKVGAKQLTATALRDKTSGIKQFSEHANGDSFNGNTEDILMSYRAKLLTKLATGDYSGNTVNDKLKFARQFIRWCWESRKLDEMPRCMDSFSKRVDVEKGGKPIDQLGIGKLWASAGERMKCFVAIALNTGMKNGGIAALKGSSVKSNRLIGYRPKTSVPFNVKLWPVTVKLIEKCRDTKGDDQQLFTNSEGNAIKSDVISSLFKKVSTKGEVFNGTTKAGKPRGATFEQLRDTSAENVRKLLRNTGADMGLLQVFLQHKDKTTAAFYISDRAEDNQSDKLDEITDHLGDLYGLKL